MYGKIKKVKKASMPVGLFGPKKAVAKKAVAKKTTIRKMGNR